MAHHHQILARLYPLLRITKAIGRPLGLTSSDRLRVLLYHDVAPYEESQFAAQLDWLRRTWTFVTPERFGAMMLGNEPIRGFNLLLTFDDGLASNRVVAEKVLNPLGIRALFFVVSDFTSIHDYQEARRFISKHIWPGTQADDLPEHWYNMGWHDLEALLEQGHSIGGHTRTHARLSRIHSEEGLVHEIVASANTVEERLGAPVEHFAYTFGDLGSFSENALAVASLRFRFVYSGLRGENTCGVSPFTLRRDAITAQYSTALVGAFLEGAADFYYAGRCYQLGSWVRTIDGTLPHPSS